MLWIPLFLLGLTRLTPSLGQFVYAYDAESNGPPQSDLFNPSSFRYVPPSEIQRDTGTNYVGRASTVSGRVAGSREVPSRSRASSRPQQSIATRTFATASEYFHPTRGDNDGPTQPYVAPAPAPQPAPRRTYQPAPQRTYVPPPPPQQTYQPPPEPVAQPAPQYHLVHQADQYEISRQQLYADQPRQSTPYQYVATYPQTHQASSPFSSYQAFHQPAVRTEAPRVIYRQAEHQPLSNFQYEAPIYSNSPDPNPGPAQASFFRTAGGRPFVNPPQPDYQPAEPYQYHYRPTLTEPEYQAPAQEYQELQPEQPYEYQQPPQDNIVEEAPRPVPTRGPSRQRTRTRTRPVAYEPAPTQRPRSRPQPAPREEPYVAPQPEKRPQRRPASTPTEERNRPAAIGVARLPADVDGDGIPGRGGVDYPVLSEIPKTSFSCSRQPINGYYADLETSCQVVHSCQAGGIQHSFLCPNGTVFNQEKFSCQWWYRVDCSQASQYYALNDKLYRTTDAPRRRAQPPPPPTTRAPQPQPPARRAPQPQQTRRAPPPPQEEEIVYEQPAPTRGPSRAQKRRQRQRARAEEEAALSNRG